MNQKDVMKTEAQMESEANAATKVLSGAVKQLMDDGVEPAALSEALAAALGVMLAAAPRHMSKAVDDAIWKQVQRSKEQTWAAVDTSDAAAPVH